jgi:hypothetical protein
MIQGLLCAAVAVALIVFCVVKERRVRADFEERFPPISDEEFLARCQPGTDPKVALGVRRIIAEVFAIEYERVHPSMRLTKDLGA